MKCYVVDINMVIIDFLNIELEIKQNKLIDRIFCINCIIQKSRLI